MEVKCVIFESPKANVFLNPPKQFSLSVYPKLPKKITLKLGDWYFKAKSKIYDIGMNFCFVFDFLANKSKFWVDPLRERII